MPAIAKVTKEMIIDAAFNLTRETGIENVNARTVSEILGCSTQPIMYHFKTIADLKRAVYEKVDKYHTEYLMNIPKTCDGFMLGIGLNYILFAIKEPNFFRFLFQSGFIAEKNLLEMIGSEELVPIISAMQTATGMNMKQTKTAFLTISMFAHGYASIIANNSLVYDEEVIKRQLKQVYKGAILAALEESK